MFRKALAAGVLAGAALLTGCASGPTPYQPGAADSGDRGYSESKIENDRYRISFKGNSMIDTAFPFAGSPNKGGDLVLGISGVYLSKWTANLSYVRYLGKIDTQAMLDRDYIRFSLQTSF